VTLTFFVGLRVYFLFSNHELELEPINSLSLTLTHLWPELFPGLHSAKSGPVCY
jgi:hypothetical protein